MTQGMLTPLQKTVYKIQGDEPLAKRENKIALYIEMEN